MKKGSKSSIVSASKEAERRVARVYGGRRLTAGEWNGKGDVDVITPLYAIQVKHRSNVPAYLLEGIRQAQEGAADTKEMIRLFGIEELAKDTKPPEPILVIITKPGRGRKSRTFELKEIFEE